MTSDYPDFMRLFWLMGVNITIPINIESSDVILPISIDAATATIDINIVGSDITVSFNFADQSVAVFDAAKWFAHNAEQVFVTGSVNGAEGAVLTVVDYTVPADKVFFAVGVSWVGPMIDGDVYVTSLSVLIGATGTLSIGSRNGSGLPLDTPLRAVAGEHVYLKVKFYAMSSPHLVYGSVWGYLEDA